jgi:hypothetical protein
LAQLKPLAAAAPVLQWLKFCADRIADLGRGNRADAAAGRKIMAPLRSDFRPGVRRDLMTKCNAL